LELIVFDLDGTLLNRDSFVSEYTAETLRLLSERNIAYTLATGRTLHASRGILKGHNFKLPQIYKNGVMIWQPQEEQYSHKILLSQAEVKAVLQAFIEQQVTPFIFTLKDGHKHAVYHPPIQNEVEMRLAEELSINRGLPVRPASELPGDVDITNISALGPKSAIEAIAQQVEAQDHLVAYLGAGIQVPGVHWLDVHHSEGSKGAAVAQLRKDLGASKVLCFGDSDNDLSMFAQADEAYAPQNSLNEVKAAATEVIGHHDEDGIARFLRQRFSL